ncbi:hypothetical protein G6F40_016718 [Rhizopus arrhizus]|nr:hypothetical protein G6F40_016718 [Rhizopus arrhizus]
MTEQVAGRALQLAADRIEGGKADGACLAGLQDRQVRQGDVDAPGQLGQGHAPFLQHAVEGDDDRHQRVPIRPDRPGHRASPRLRQTRAPARTASA